VKIRKKARRKPQLALPTLFTVGTLFCGYYTLVQTIKAVSLPAHQAADAARLFDYAAIAIGIAMLTDGLDGRIARLTNATSKFGGELDSLADCITFGAGPALLAFAWGMRGDLPSGGSPLLELLPPLGYFCTFLYLTCAAARLARFNVQADPRPKNPGLSHRGYFVGIPSPPSAGLLGAVVHFSYGRPIEQWWPGGLLWCGLLAGLGLLMISSWRYRSFKELNFMQRRVTVVFFASLIFLIWNFSRPVLLTMAATFAASGVLTRVAGLFRRRPLDAERPAAVDGPQIPG
jgi:CDP-diacylglycerol--serine O-phosphatidyltransferase